MGDNQSFESNARKILIVDAHANSRAFLTQVLRANGFHIGESNGPEQALGCLEQEHFDAVFFHFPFDDSNDDHLLSSVRQISPEILIVVQDSNPTIERTIAAIKASVADYLTGPWDTQNVARGIINTIRRHHERIRWLTHYVSQAIEAYYTASGVELEVSNEPGMELGSTLTAGNLQLVRITRTLIYLGEERFNVKLTKGECDVLAVLMSHPGEAMSCWTIVREAWGYDMHDVEAKSVVRPHISRLRRKLSDTPIDPAAITTVHGLGYVFIPTPVVNSPGEDNSK